MLETIKDVANDLLALFRFFPAVPPTSVPSMSAASQVDDEKPSGKKGKGKRRGNKKGFNKDDDSDTEEQSKVNETSCAVCKTDFQSKNKLFAHLKSSGHAVPLAR